MKLGIRLPTYAVGGEYSSFSVLKDYVQTAEEMGVEGFFTIDHMLVTPPAYTCTWQDSLTAMTFVAAVTKHARIGPLVLALPTRNPYTLAKQVATIDVYSGGRFVLGAGVGWNAAEFELFRVPFGERGRILDEYLPLLKSLWSDSEVTHKGKYFQVERLSLFPKPIQKPHPPIWIGAGSQPFQRLYGFDVKTNVLNRALLRVAKYADGWIPHSSATPEMVRRDWEIIKKYSMELGRDPYKLTRVYSNFIYITQDGEQSSEVTQRFKIFSGMNLEYWKEHYLVGTASELAQRIKARLASLEGADWVVLNPPSFDLTQLRLIVESLFPQLLS